MQMDQVAGDFTFRAERTEDGRLAFSRKVNNTPGADFEEVSLNDVPVQVISAARTYKGMTGS